MLRCVGREINRAKKGSMAPDSIANLRDCGGLPASDGRRLRHGWLYRAGDPSRTRAAARRQLQTLGLRTRVDLRSARERRGHELTLAGVRTVHLPIALAELTRKRLGGLLPKRDATEAIAAVMASVYAEMVDLAIAPLGALLQLLLDPRSYPVLIHCRAGKDRTGLACAVIQMAVGITPEAILQDYLRSNDAVALPAWLTWLRLLSLGRFPTRNFEMLYAAQPRYLLAALERIGTVYGGVTAYLARGGFPEGGLARLQAQLLEG